MRLGSSQVIAVLITATPAPPVSGKEAMLLSEIPPSAMTGIETLWQISDKNAKPLGGTFFLQSVGKIGLAVITVAPMASASKASDRE